MAIVRWSGSPREFAWVPPVDIYQTGDQEVVLKAELPDISRDDIDITVEIAPDVRVGVIAYVGIVQFIEDMFPTGEATTRRCFSICEQGRPILASARSGIFRCSAPRGTIAGCTVA